MTYTRNVCACVYVCNICHYTSGTLFILIERHIYIYIYIHTHIHTHTYICMYVYVCVCVCVKIVTELGVLGELLGGEG